MTEAGAGDSAADAPGPAAGPQLGRPAESCADGDDPLHTPDKSPENPAISKGRSRRRTPWRDHLEALTVAILLAVVLKHFIVEAYKIPTGSMQPTLMGDEATGVFDRILVDKLSYRFRDPKRFEVAVFRYPLDRSKNFVKRIVGLPGEQIRIRYGDVWVRANDDEAWAIPRRPGSVRRSTWKRLDKLTPERSSWSSVGSSEPWSFDGRSIRASGRGMARFGTGAYITDDYAHGYPDALAASIVSMQGSGGENSVGDLRVEALVTPGPECEEVLIELSEGPRRYRFRFPGPAAPADARPSITLTSSKARPRTVQSDEPMRLRAGQATRIAAENLDDQLALNIESNRPCHLDVEPTYDQVATVQLGVQGNGETRFDDLMVYRDIFYTESGKTLEATIPDGMYFALGDNTQDSSDSRHWTFAAYDVEVEDGRVETIRGDLRRGNENPRIEYGGIDGPIYWLEDEFGERRRFEHRATSGPKRYEVTPFIDRRLFQGRALAVFWPLNPRRDLYRWKWVH